MSKKRRTYDTQKAAEPAASSVSTFVRDAFSNPMARLGFDTPNVAEGAGYVNNRLGRNYQLMNTLYRTSWIIGKIINIVPEDMTKAWYDVRTQADPEMVEKLKRLEMRTQVKAKIQEGLCWGRLYGGAVALMLIEGHDDILHEPLDLDTVMPGSFKGLLILDRWSGVYPQMDLCNDLSDPEFGLPESYEITSETFGAVVVHHSRILRFTGFELPKWERVAEIYWGASVIERVYEDLKRRDNTGANIEALVFLANLRVMKMSGMGEMLAATNTQAQERIQNVLQAQNWLASNMGVQILNKDDDYQTHQFAFSGLSDIYQNFMMDVSGASNIPVTKLFGRSPAGMNATGESDMNNYYDFIETEQEGKLRPVLNKLLPVMCMSEFGAIPDDLDFVFNPVRRPSDQERTSMAKDRTSSILEPWTAGLIPDKVAMQELREMSDVTGMWTNITDAMIEAASEVVEPKGELLGMPGIEPMTNEPAAPEQVI